MNGTVAARGVLRRMLAQVRRGPRERTAIARARAFAEAQHGEWTAIAAGDPFADLAVRRGLALSALADAALGAHGDAAGQGRAAAEGGEGADGGRAPLLRGRAYGDAETWARDAVRSMPGDLRVRLTHLAGGTGAPGADAALLAALDPPGGGAHGNAPPPRDAGTDAAGGGARRRGYAARAAPAGARDAADGGPRLSAYGGERRGAGRAVRRSGSAAPRERPAAAERPGGTHDRIDRLERRAASLEESVAAARAVRDLPGAVAALRKRIGRLERWRAAARSGAPAAAAAAPPGGGEASLSGAQRRLLMVAENSAGAIRLARSGRGMRRREERADAAMRDLAEAALAAYPDARAADPPGGDEDETETTEREDTR